MAHYYHNQTVLRSLRVGDLVEFKRSAVYSHWAVYVGNEEVVHLWAEDNDGLGDVQPALLFAPSGLRTDKAVIRKDPFWKVTKGDMAIKNNDRDSSWSALSGYEVAERALQRLGEEGYNILYSNCEHFAKWCRYNLSKSDQVENFLTGAAVVAGGVLAAGLVAGMARFFGTNEEDEKEKKRKNKSYDYYLN